MLFNKGWFSKFMDIFGYLMAAIYVGLGIMLFLPRVYPNVPGVLKFSFALFFIAYGFYRLVKLLSKKTESNE
jgi:hypothetical protein